MVTPVQGPASQGTVIQTKRFTYYLPAHAEVSFENIYDQVHQWVYSPLKEFLRAGAQSITSAIKGDVFERVLPGGHAFEPGTEAFEAESRKIKAAPALHKTLLTLLESTVLYFKAMLARMGILLSPTSAAESPDRPGDANFAEARKKA